MFYSLYILHVVEEMALPSYALHTVKYSYILDACSLKVVMPGAGLNSTTSLCHANKRTSGRHMMEVFGPMRKHRL